MGDIDLVIRGGTVLDGTGAAPRDADVAVGDGRVLANAPGLPRGREQLDARQLRAGSEAANSVTKSPRADAKGRRPLLRAGSAMGLAMAASGCVRGGSGAFREVEQITLPRDRGIRSIVGDIAWSPDGTAIAATSRVTPLAVLWRSGGRLISLQRQSAFPVYVGFVDGGSGFITGPGSAVPEPPTSLATIFDVRDGRALRTLASPLTFPTGRPAYMAMDGARQRLLFSYGRHRDLVLIDASDGRQLAHGLVDRFVIRALAIDPSGEVLAVGGFDTTLGGQLTRGPKPLNATSAMVLLLDQNSLVRHRASIQQPTDDITTAAFDATGRMLAAAGNS